MRKNASTATKQGLKNSPVNNKKPRRGGARPGAGRKSTKGETKQLHVDMPVSICSGMEDAGIKNKSAFIIALVASSLVKSKNINAKKKAEIQAFASYEITSI